jgi:hypothetical protein
LPRLPTTIGAVGAGELGFEHQRSVSAGAGAISQRPWFALPRSAEKHAAESKRGQQSQSTEPSLETSAAVPPANQFIGGCLPRHRGCLCDCGGRQRWKNTVKLRNLDRPITR